MDDEASFVNIGRLSDMAAARLLSPILICSTFGKSNCGLDNSESDI
jgi:hypothetical protein